MLQCQAEDIGRERLTTGTLITAMERIQDAPESGMRFLGPGAEDRYFTYRQLYAEARHPAAHLSWMGVTTEAVFAGDPPPFDPPQVYHEDICFLQYTSGGATSPRGVMVRIGGEYGN